MANVTISDLAISPVSESFITELDEHSMDGILGGCKVKYRRNGSIRKIKNCSAAQIKEILEAHK
ncbi:hypothetical protein BJP36_02250 [Moorena producens JHB]|uniref:Uncharacterized protein n=1 Tax=Moorena producens (strain JHB) TaxID=1454205 RepID=A0A1D9FU54_MOOP1|nr:hypothetical protein [Moorena producens]AOY78892.1 hypothetical protein BJP36_02250 [Moorena producens JHB]